MDSRKIEIFLVTLEAGSFSRSAEKLHCTQSAVTQAINSLENELGFKVLNRSHKGVTLTKAGERILPRIQDVNDSLMHLFEETKYISTGNGRPLRIGAFASIANNWLPQKIQLYQTIHPQARFEITIGTEKLKDMLEDGKLDIALGDFKQQSFSQYKSHLYYPIKEDQFCAIVPESMVPDDCSSIPLEQLFQKTVILSPQTRAELNLDSVPDSSISIDSDDDFVLLSMVTQGIGISLIPEIYIEQIPENVRILNVDPPIKRSLGALISVDAEKPVREFVNLLLSID